MRAHKAVPSHLNLCVNICIIYNIYYKLYIYDSMILYVCICHAHILHIGRYVNGISCEALFERACAQADELDFDFRSGCGHHQGSYPKQLLGLGLSHPLPSILSAITCSGISDWIHSGCCPCLPHLRLDFPFPFASEPPAICAFQGPGPKLEEKIGGVRSPLE